METINNEQRAALYGLLITLIGFCQAEEWLHNIVNNNDKMGAIKYLRNNGFTLSAAVYLANRFSNLTMDDLNEIFTISGWD
jgi:hypothetical protein